LNLNLLSLESIVKENSINHLSGSSITKMGKNRLRVAVEESFAPFVQLENGRVIGLAVDILDALADRIGLSLEYVSGSASEIQAMIACGEADAIFPLAINPERQAKFDFSEALLSTGGALFVVAPNPTPANLGQLAGKKVATPGTGPLAAFLRAHAPETILIETQDYLEPLNMVVSGEVYAAALNLQAGCMLADQFHAGRLTRPDAYFLELPLALGVLKNSPENTKILDRINEGIQSSGKGITGSIGS
jgi:ABC-type amino acid transport substrate-binding protein